MTLRPEIQSGGHTLFELVLVVAVLAVMASVAIPSMTVSSGQELSYAISEVADAFRFARDEAGRTGIMHGVEADETTGVVRVFWLQEKAGAPVPVFDLHHPVTRQPYKTHLGVSPFARIQIASVGGDPNGTCSKANSFAFDARGAVHCIDPVTTLVNNAFVELTDASHTAMVKLDAYTGRVLVQ